MTPEPIKTIEKAARTCYKSEQAIGDGTAERLVTMLIKNGHTAMLEHGVFSYRVICDRGVTHEIVRHRIASYAQESTRYVNYKNKGLVVVKPSTFYKWTYPQQEMWRASMKAAEQHYNYLITSGLSPQESRSVLPNSTKTEIVMTLNLRSWMNFFKLRCAKAAHPDIQVIANLLLADMKQKVPIIFEEENDK